MVTSDPASELRTWKTRRFGSESKSAFPLYLVGGLREEGKEGKKEREGPKVRGQM
jgi:hypothetical protein